MFDLTDENYVKTLQLTKVAWTVLSKQEWQHLSNSSAKIFNEDLFIKYGDVFSLEAYYVKLQFRFGQKLLWM